MKDNFRANDRMEDGALLDWRGVNYVEQSTPERAARTLYYDKQTSSRYARG